MTSTGSSSFRDISHGHDGSYEGWDETTPTIRRQTRDPPPPDVKQCDNDVQRRRRRQRKGGRLIIDLNDNNGGGILLYFDNEPNEYNDQIQRAIYHGMGGTYNFFLLLYSR